MPQYLVDFLYSLMFAVECVVLLVFAIKLNVYLFKKHLKTKKERQLIANKIRDIQQSPNNNLSPEERDLLDRLLKK